ncbi:zinc finger domain-containing protein [Streptomyces sp. NPDC002125]
MPNRPTHFPALAVACPTCRSQPGQLCTSHSGTHIRRHDVHPARTAAHQATQQPA